MTATTPFAAWLRANSDRRDRLGAACRQLLADRDWQAPDMAAALGLATNAYQHRDDNRCPGCHRDLGAGPAVREHTGGTRRQWHPRCFAAAR